MKKPASRLTVIIMGRLGKVREFKISGLLLFFAALFILFYISVTLCMVNNYLDLRRTCSYQNLQIETMRSALKNKEKTLYRLRQRASLLNQHIEKLKSEKNPPKEEWQEPENETVDQDSIPAKGPSAEIKDYGIIKKGPEMTVLFKLVNSNQEKGPISGYVHIVAVDENAEPHQLWSNPKVAIRGGIPVDFKKGQPFLIKRFKAMSGTYHFDSPETVPTSIRILVYNNEGDLMLEEKYKVKIDA